MIITTFICIITITFNIALINTSAGGEAGRCGPIKILSEKTQGVPVALRLCPRRFAHFCSHVAQVNPTSLESVTYYGIPVPAVYWELAVAWIFCKRPQRSRSSRGNKELPEWNFSAIKMAKVLAVVPDIVDESAGICFFFANSGKYIVSSIGRHEGI